MTTTPTRPLRERIREQIVRSALIRLKWVLLDALEQWGETPETLCKLLGKPWTPTLLKQAFPDVWRKAKQ